jgi:acyl-CoA thioesterase
MGYLEEVRKIGRDANPFFRLRGIEVESFGKGRARLSMNVRPDMQNGAGWLQGGLYGALCDEAMALALYTILEEGEQIATISESTSYLRGVRDGKVQARAQIVRKVRQGAFLEGSVTDAEDALLSKTTASFTIFTRRTPRTPP